MTPPDALVVAARRTPIGTAGRGLASLSAAELAAPVLAAVAADASAALGHEARVSEVLLGNCMGPGGDVARVATLLSGLGDEVPALTVDRQCASGLAAVELGARAVAEDSIVVAGGTESASTAPWRSWPPQGDGDTPVRYERAPFAPPGRDPDMGLAADLLAERYGVSRIRQDEYAARSHQRAWAALRRGAFAVEVVPAGGLDRDERLRDRVTVERLARHPAAFRSGGTVTAGNSCGINDGAAAVALGTARAGVRGLRIRGAASAGIAPELPGLGLVPAVRAALGAAGLSVADIDVWEVNEAFAGQVLTCYDALGVDEERVCTEGGAIALGHPWGASGAVLLVRLFHQLLRPGASARFGVAAIAAGGGQGTAVVVEACR